MKFSHAGLFFSRFLAKPFRVASMIPSSAFLVHEVQKQLDFSGPRTFVELGAGEGVHTREILRCMDSQSRLVVFELDPVLAENLKEELSGDIRVRVIQANALDLKNSLEKIGIQEVDYVVSGIPFSLMPKEQKAELLEDIFYLLKAGGAFVSYQVSRELNRFAVEIFDRIVFHRVLRNIPPMWVNSYFKYRSTRRIDSIFTWMESSNPK